MIHLLKDADGQYVERFETWQWVLVHGDTGHCCVCGSPIHGGRPRWRRVPFDDQVHAHVRCVKEHKGRGQ